MKEIARKALLYDFYGELLTEHQKAVYEDAVMNDYSLSELAEEYHISRQGIHDLLKRCDGILEEYEEKLGLIRRFSIMKQIADDMISALNDLDAEADDVRRNEIMHTLRKDLARLLNQ